LKLGSFELALTPKNCTAIDYLMTAFRYSIDSELSLRNWQIFSL